MAWEEFMEMERERLSEDCQGKLRRTLGTPLQGESVQLLDRIGEKDVIRAQQGLVAVVGVGGAISYKHIDDLGRLDMNSRTAAERVTVEWLKERVGRKREGAEAPPIPTHLR
jgi:hypothetical protein